MSRNYQWPDVWAELETMELMAASDQIETFFDTDGGKLLRQAVEDAMRREYRSLRDTRVAAGAEAAIEANGRLDVLEVLREPGFGLVAKIKKRLEAGRSS